MANELKIDWATHEASKFACENWHYSKCIPKSKLVKIGAWENGQFIGVVIFGYGATASLGMPYGLGMTECCELVRIAFKTHKTPISKICSLAIRFLKKKSPGIKLIVSYADPGQGHHGGIYQAMNWIYNGKTPETKVFIDPFGKIWHGRRASEKYNPQKKLVTSDWKKVIQQGKHRYLMPLDKEMRDKIAPLAKPYPKRAKEQESGNPLDLGGATPTRTLQIQSGHFDGKD